MLAREAGSRFGHRRFTSDGQGMINELAAPASGRGAGMVRRSMVRQPDVAAAPRSWLCRGKSEHYPTPGAASLQVNCRCSSRHYVRW